MKWIERTIVARGRFTMTVKSGSMQIFKGGKTLLLAISAGDRMKAELDPQAWGEHPIPNAHEF
jgi:hypothetical protein